MRILLVCDQKWRDLPSLVVVRHYLKRLGHRVFILSTKEFEALIPVFRPDCVVLNNFWEKRYHKLARRLRECGIAVVVFPTEGATPTHLWGPMVFGEFSDYSLIDYQMCWNYSTADGIVEFGSMPREKLDVVGCPRFDFALQPLIDTCATREQVCRVLGLNPLRPVVTWASRFALARLCGLSDDAMRSVRAKFDEIGYTQCVERLGYKLEDHINIYGVSLEKFLAAFEFAAASRPDVQFLFKPHPNDDVHAIRARLKIKPLTNARLVLGVYIGDVLRTSDVLVNSDCNTSVEAWLHGIPVVDAQLHRDFVAGRPDISAGNWVAQTAEEIIALIDLGLSDRTISPSKQRVRDAFIAQWFYKVDGHRCEAAANSLDRFLATREPRRRSYPVADGGGMEHVCRQTLAWLANLPGGYPLGLTHWMRGRDTMPRGTFDKVISRRDVTRIERLLTPKLAA